MSRIEKIITGVQKLFGHSAERTAERAAEAVERANTITAVNSRIGRLENPALIKDEAEFIMEQKKFHGTLQQKELIDTTRTKHRDANTALAALAKGEKVSPQEVRAIDQKFANDFSQGKTGIPTVTAKGPTTIPPTAPFSPTPAGIGQGGLVGSLMNPVFSAISRAPNWIKYPLAAYGIVHVVAVDNPLTPGQESLGIQAYKSYESIRQGKPTAEINKEIAQAKQESQVTSTKQGATSVLIATGSSVLTGESTNTPDSLASYFKDTVKKANPSIDDKKLDTYSKRFAIVAGGLDSDSDGAINNQERTRLANSMEFIELMREITELQPKQKTAVLNAMLPGPAGPSSGPK